MVAVQTGISHHWSELLYRMQGEKGDMGQEGEQGGKGETGLKGKEGLPGDAGLVGVRVSLCVAFYSDTD